MPAVVEHILWPERPVRHRVMLTSRHAEHVLVVHPPPGGTVHACIWVVGEAPEHEPPPQSGVVQLRVWLPFMSHGAAVFGVHDP